MNLYSPDNDAVALDLIRILCKNDRQYIAPNVLRRVYHMYMQWIRLPKQWPGYRSFQRDVLLYLAERCYWMQYGDSEVVTNVIRHLFNLDCDLGPIFLNENVFPNEMDQSRLRSFWNKDFLGNEKVQPLHFFMDHINRRRILFNGMRLQDSAISYCGLPFPPCSVARMCQSPETFIYLLKHGALIHEDGRSHHLNKLLRWSMGSIMTACSYTGLGTMDTSSINFKTIRVSLACGNRVLRMAPNIDVDTLFSYHAKHMSPKQKASIIEQMSERYLLPSLKNRCLEIMELSHMCRRVIRRILYNGWQLPYGIESLPVPHLLKEYLYLERD